MVAENTFNEIKSIFTQTLKDLDINENLIEELLPDDFIQGLVELKKEEPLDNKLILMLQNFSDEQTLSSLQYINKEMRKEFSQETYATKVLNYINTSWKNIDFSQNVQVSYHNDDEIGFAKKTIAILRSTYNYLAGKFGVGRKILSVEISVPLEIAERLDKRQEEELLKADTFEQDLRKVMFGSYDKNKMGKETASPLIIDMDGDGVETSKAEDGVYFDHDGNGFAEKSGWVGQDDGLLVRDINGNGEIDNGTELFGNNSVLSSGEKAANGFEALKDLDSNGDGVFNAEDNAWSEVKIWQDANGNGKVDSNELLTLEQANIIIAA